MQLSLEWLLKIRSSVETEVGTYCLYRANDAPVPFGEAIWISSLCAAGAAPAWLSLPWPAPWLLQLGHFSSLCFLLGRSNSICFYLLCFISCHENQFSHPSLRMVYSLVKCLMPFSLKLLL